MTLMTEDEAIRCWCPAALTAAEGTGLAMTFNRPFGWNKAAGRDCACIASRCMAWRWVLTHVRDDDAPDAFGNKPGTRLATRAYGYCGLAGPVTQP